MNEQQQYLHKKNFFSFQIFALKIAVILSKKGRNFSQISNFLLKMKKTILSKFGDSETQILNIVILSISRRDHFFAHIEIIVHVIILILRE